MYLFSKYIVCVYICKYTHVKSDSWFNINIFYRMIPSLSFNHKCIVLVL